MDENGRTAFVTGDYSFISYPKFFEKLPFFTPLLRTRTFACQGLSNVCFSENFACVLNKWSPADISKSHWCHFTKRRSENMLKYPLPLKLLVSLNSPHTITVHEATFFCVLPVKNNALQLPEFFWFSHYGKVIFLIMKVSQYGGSRR